MQSFIQYMEDAWGHQEQDQAIIDQISTKLESLKGDLQLFTEKLSHGDDPVNHAMDHMMRSFNVLCATFKTSVIKNKVNPEMSDNPPVETQ